MASSDHDRSASGAAEHVPMAAQPIDTIVLHILSPSPELVGGRITFPSIPLDTKISHLKSRIQSSITTAPTPPELQRLIYCGRALLNMDATLRQVLQPELQASADQSPVCTIHMIITHPPGSAQGAASYQARNRSSQSVSAPNSTPQAPPPPPPPPPAPNHHHPPFPRPPHPAMAQAQAPQSVLLQRQMMAPQMADQGQRPGPAPGLNRLPQLPVAFPTAPQAMPAFQFGQQQQQTRTGGSVNSVQNHSSNGLVPGMTVGQHPQAFGPITTRVHETVGPDGQRTRIVVNETTFQISRQSTPVPNPSPNPTEIRRDSETATATPNDPSIANAARPYVPPTGSNPARPTNPSQLHAPQLPPPLNLDLNPPVSPYEPTVPAPGYDAAGIRPPSPYQPTFSAPGDDLTSIRQRSWAAVTPVTTTTVFLVSGPNGPQALVLAPGHGVFTNSIPTSYPSIRHHGPHLSSRSQQTLGGPTQAENPHVAPAVPAVERRPATSRPPRQQLQQAMDQVRNAAATARHDHARANVNANHELVHILVNRAWTFIKLYFVIFLFTKPGTWFRWISLLAAVLVSGLPSTRRFQDIAARVQAEIDDLLAPVQHRAQPARQRAPDQPRAPNGTDASGRDNAPLVGQAEPDPAETAARLVRDHEQRHPNALRDGFERLERAVALFFASLIPGVGERHVRIREEARRESERERNRLATEEEDRRRRNEEKQDPVEDGMPSATSSSATEKESVKETEKAEAHEVATGE